MKVEDVLQLLARNENQRGIENWEKRYSGRDGLKSFGIGLTVLRKLAKKIGRNRELALELWTSDYYDAKVIALLIDDPKQITREQAEEQVDDLNQGFLAHVFSSCDASLAKTSFAKDLAGDWIKSDSKIRRSCGYGLVYELSKSKKKDAPSEEYFHACIDLIENTFANERPPQNQCG